MSVSATASVQPPLRFADSLVPTLPSENAATAATQDDAQKLHMFGAEDDTPSFWDLVDVINPLQHIPVVGDLYREMTGDKIGVGARLAGGALYGGPVGLIASAIGCIVEESTGHDIGGHVIALFKDNAAPGATAIAAAEPATKPATATTTDTAQAATPTAAPVDATAQSGQSAKPLIMPNLLGAESPAPAAQPVAAVTTAAEMPPVAPPSAAPQPVTPALPTSVAEANAAAAAAAAAGGSGRSSKSLWGREARVMPAPARSGEANAKPLPPQVNVPMSTNGSRSNVPITGARPTPMVTSPAMVQQMIAAQANTAQVNATHTETAATATLAPGGEWFNAAMMGAMDKYERGNRLGQTGNSTVAQP
jgi:hypothetical protein